MEWNRNNWCDPPNSWGEIPHAGPIVNTVWWRKPRTKRTDNCLRTSYLEQVMGVSLTVWHRYCEFSFAKRSTVFMLDGIETQIG